MRSIVSLLRTDTGQFMVALVAFAIFAAALLALLGGTSALL